MHNETLVLALDLGTSSVRAMLFDAHGQAMPDSEAQVKYTQTTTRDGGVETDPVALLAHTVTAVEKLLKATAKRDVSRIAAIGVSCFWHSLLGLNDDLEAITPVYSWADTRSRDQAAALHRHLDEDDYHTRTGCFLHSSYWPAKLMWLAADNPELFGCVKKWIGFGEYVLLNLTGSQFQSRSMASATGLYNGQDNEWDASVLKTVHVDESALFAVDKQDRPVSTLSEVYRKRLAPLDSLPWSLPVGDGACSNVGSGAFDSSRLAINIGTSGALRAATSSTKAVRGLFRYGLDNETNIVGGALANGGNAYAWMQQTLALNGGSLRQIARMAPDSHGLTVLPFWAGERSPGWHSDARASIIGLNLHSSAAEIARATLESIAYTLDSIRIPLQEHYPEAKVIVASGGALSHDPQWMQIMSDVFGTPVVQSTVPEATSRGAALLASRKAGLIKSLSQSSGVLGRRFLPHPERHKIYRKAIDRYSTMYQFLIERESDK